MHPIVFRLGPVTVYSYGVLLACAFLLATATAAARFRRYGWRPEAVYDLGIYALLAAVAGSRLLYVIEDPAEFLSSPLDVFKVWRGGLSYHGGLFAAVLAGVVYLRRHRMNIAEAFDLLIPSVALGHAVGRIGCFLNGCCFGTPAAPPWGIVFPAGSEAHAFHVAAGLVPPGSAGSLPVYPTQLYESLAELGIFVALSLYLPRRRFRGEVFWLYILMYGVVRFSLEYLRADNPTVLSLGGAGMSLPQVIGLGMAAVSAAVILLGERRARGCRRTGSAHG